MLSAEKRKKRKTRSADNGPRTFPIVAIGSSAGGLEAFILLLKFLPADTGMAFIYVQHLSPKQKNLTALLLARQTKMKVREIKQMEVIKPNNIYVIPSSKGITVTNGHIRLISRNAKGPNLSIDTLFVSLSETHREEVIGIVLSGNAHDGTEGLKAIKAEGGITFAQDSSAKNMSMPRSATESRVADFVMPPRSIAVKLGHLAELFRKTGTLHARKIRTMQFENNDLQTILTILHRQLGIDFSAYKPNTIKRRILRRILLKNIESVKKYISLLAEKKGEAEILYRDLLIHFTSFFREPETYVYLKKDLFPKLLKKRTSENPLRVWIVACSTGEEAYSVAMCLHEVLGPKFSPDLVQIFATDLSPYAITKARRGVYSKEDIKMISPGRIARYFSKTESGYRISKSIRNMCVFAPHNVLNDPPFSRVDLICCRNMLIYLDIETQKKVMSIFHYALNTGAYLVLGKSETVGASGYLFDLLERNYKVYVSKRHSSKPDVVSIRPGARIARHSLTEGIHPVRKLNARDTSHLERKIESVFTSHFFPSGVVINHDLEILLFKGNTSNYLENISGKASFNISRMARPEFAFELRNTLNRSVVSGSSERSSEIEIKRGFATYKVTIEVIPLNEEEDERLMLVLFHDKVAREKRGNDTDEAKSGTHQARSKELEKELAAVKADMVMAAEKHDASVEELQSANEEIVSSNEEFQSLNEELETSREEIESTNEELNTTVQELMMQNELLAESYQYSEEIVAMIHEPMVILDQEFKVKNANTSFYKQFNLKAEDVEGKSIYRIYGKRWNIPKLKQLLENILLRNSNFKAFPISLDRADGRSIVLLLNAKRIVQKSHKVNLILLAMEDITSKSQTLKKRNPAGVRLT